MCEALSREIAERWEMGCARASLYDHMMPSDPDFVSTSFVSGACARCRGMLLLERDQDGTWSYWGRATLRGCHALRAALEGGDDDSTATSCASTSARQAGDAQPSDDRRDAVADTQPSHPDILGAGRALGAGFSLSGGSAVTAAGAGADSSNGPSFAGHVGRGYRPYRLCAYAFCQASFRRVHQIGGGWFCSEACARRDALERVERHPAPHVPAVTSPPTGSVARGLLRGDWSGRPWVPHV